MSVVRAILGFKSSMEALFLANIILIKNQGDFFRSYKLQALEVDPLFDHFQNEKDRPLSAKN